MLVNSDLFNRIEKSLKDNGVLEQYEKDEGKVIGRMMISVGDVPKDINISSELTESTHCFIASFDFYDVEIGLLLDIKTKRTKSGIFIVPQSENHQEPTQEWVEFFISILAEYLEVDENGSFYTPIYTFIFKEADFTVVPTAIPEL